MNYLVAAFLGVVEGLTEFLPVSSTGHLILFVDLLNFQAPKGKAFEIMIQLGAVLAIMLVYAKKLIDLLVTLPFDRRTQMFAVAILIAFFPAVIVGVLFSDFIKGVLFSPWVVAVSLVTGGILMLIVEARRPEPTIQTMEDMPLITALKIGLCQCVAMIPGVSRSGATIVGAMLFRVERRAAAEFSFFLAMPTMLGAFVYSAWKIRKELTLDDAGLIGIGFVTAFLAGLVVVRLFLGIVSRYGFAPFAYYRILLGSFVLGLLIMMR
jgi:undecaprenyl-diphosphatase